MSARTVEQWKGFISVFRLPNCDLNEEEWPREAEHGHQATGLAAVPTHGEWYLLGIYLEKNDIDVLYMSYNV